jgi:hypothetical protein
MVWILALSLSLTRKCGEDGRARAMQSDPASTQRAVLDPASAHEAIAIRSRLDSAGSVAVTVQISRAGSFE